MCVRHKQKDMNSVVINDDDDDDGDEGDDDPQMLISNTPVLIPDRLGTQCADR